MTDPALQSFFSAHQITAYKKISVGDSCDFVYKLVGKKNLFILKILNLRRPLQKRKAVVHMTAWAGREGLGPELVWHDKTYHYMVMAFSKGRCLRADDLKNPLLFEKVVASMRKAHTASLSHLEGVFPYPLKVRALRRGKEVMSYALQNFRQIFRRLKSRFFKDSGDVNYNTVSHADIKVGNILLEEAARPIFIDWGEVTVSSPYDDLGSFAHHFELDTYQEKRLLNLYFGRGPCAEEINHLRAHRRFAALNEVFWKIRVFCEKSNQNIIEMNKSMDFLQGFL
ncbi:MAG: phosphotransferase [Holosporaceae bacterium]|nr:MAG: phosphotransferase [Holosporaceae bacterium]